MRELAPMDHSTPEAKALFEREVRRRMEPPACMDRDRAEMLTAVLLWEKPADQDVPDGR